MKPITKSAQVKFDGFPSGMIWSEEKLYRPCFSNLL